MARFVGAPSLVPARHELVDTSAVAGLTGISWRTDCTLAFVPERARPYLITVEYVAVKDATAMVSFRAAIYDVLAGSFTSAKTPPEGVQGVLAAAASNTITARAMSRTPVLTPGTPVYYQPGWQAGGGLFTMAGCVIRAEEIL